MNSSFKTVLTPMENLGDYNRNFLFSLFLYMNTYLITAGLFEWTNPAHYKNPEKRMKLIKHELSFSVPVMFYNVLYSISWFYFIDSLTPFYGYYENRDYGVFDFLLNLMSYMFIYDTWFYWTHRALHLPYFWKTIHHYHHSFIETTGFGQDSVALVEAIVQGPMGHHLVSLCVPMHATYHALFGFLTSIFAIAAHDGRKYDLNSHRKHHEFTSCNFGLYWSFWDNICGTRYSPEKYKFMNSDNFQNPPIL